MYKLRPSQQVPKGDWHTWLLIGGRGAGKTLAGALAVHKLVTEQGYRRVGLIAETDGEARNIMVEGVTGLMEAIPEEERPKYQPSKRLLTWPNGAKAYIYSAKRVNQLRGPNLDLIWVDEFAKYPNAKAVQDQLFFCLRHGKHPRLIITTTPRSTPELSYYLSEKGSVISHMTTFDNRDNLPEIFFKRILRRFEGTRYAEQELMGRFVHDTEGALWKQDMIEPYRVRGPPQNLKRIVIGVDPAVSNNKHSNQTGIIVAGLGHDNQVYVLEDLTCKASPHSWAQRVTGAYHKYQADRVVAEVNQGGDLVENVLRSADETVSYKSVRATRGKTVRAEPIVAFYEQGRVKHTKGLGLLEEQMCTYEPGVSTFSPDRMDALVWALTELLMADYKETIPKFWDLEDQYSHLQDISDTIVYDLPMG